MMSESDNVKTESMIPSEIPTLNCDKSSSTEGPDSSPRSNTSSPLADVMIPAYPDPTELFHDDDAEDQGTGKPLLPFFSVKFLDDISKDGDIVRYKLRVKKLTGPLEELENEVVLVIEREYEDFQFLHHVLTTHNQVTKIETYLPTYYS